LSLFGLAISFFFYVLLISPVLVEAWASGKSSSFALAGRCYGGHALPTHRRSVHDIRRHVAPARIRMPHLVKPDATDDSPAPSSSLSITVAATPCSSPSPRRPRPDLRWARQARPQAARGGAPLQRRERAPVAPSCCRHELRWPPLPSGGRASPARATRASRHARLHGRTLLPLSLRSPAIEVTEAGPFLIYACGSGSEGRGCVRSQRFGRGRGREETNRCKESDAR
jgi:hypothetical protein